MEKSFNEIYKPKYQPKAISPVLYIIHQQFI